MYLHIFDQYQTDGNRINIYRKLYHNAPKPSFMLHFCLIRRLAKIALNLESRADVLGKEFQFNVIAVLASSFVDSALIEYLMLKIMLYWISKL